MEGDTSRRQLILEYAREVEEFTLGDLAKEFVEEGLFGNLRNADADAAAFFHRGATEFVRGTLKSERDQGNLRIWYPLSGDRGALWKRWVRCTKRESREVVKTQNLARHRVSVETNRLNASYRERFREKVIVHRGDGSVDFERE